MPYLIYFLLDTCQPLSPIVHRKVCNTVMLIISVLSFYSCFSVKVSMKRYIWSTCLDAFKGRKGSAENVGFFCCSHALNTGTAIILVHK